MRNIIVPDKFKGSLTALEAAAAIAKGWSSIRPFDSLDILPMSDGGQGFGAVIGSLLNGESNLGSTLDAAGRPRIAEWWYNPKTQTAIIESAQIIGMDLLKPKEYHPFQLDTFGLGLVMRKAESLGALHLYIGLGGSATNDGGFGMARALGWKFWDEAYQEIVQWHELSKLKKISPPVHPFSIPDIKIVVDVENPLLGNQGATHIFGPQKGLLENDFNKAEACLEQLVTCMEQFDTLNGGGNQNFGLINGSGAAGGLGFGLNAFCKGRFEMGAEIFSLHSQLEERIKNADIVITGEGSFDAQSLMGKGVGYIAKLSLQFSKPCICLAGTVDLKSISEIGKLFEVYGISPNLANQETAIKNAGELLEQLAANIANQKTKELNLNL